MNRTDVAIVGGGQAGLALSRCLSEQGIAHAIFERGGIGERWRDNAWDSLRLLTPNWLNGLPFAPYGGADPHGFMTRDEFISTLADYASRSCLPLHCGTEVEAVEHRAGRFHLQTSRGAWHSRSVVIATGHCDKPRLPAMSAAITGQALSIHASHYRSPAQLDDGGVLVVGASSSGVQIAEELRRSGRDVVLSASTHIRLPRIWRDRDIFWWFQRMGILSERTAQFRDIQGAMRQPSMQLAGRPDRSNVDLGTLQAIGVRLAGRLEHVDGASVSFAEDLEKNIAAADAKQARLLGEIDAFAPPGENSFGEPPARIRLTAQPLTRLCLRREHIRTVIWATGYRRSFPWLGNAPLTPEGEIMHAEGVTPVPGLFALGFRFLRKRDSNFIGGVGADAQAICAEITAHLGHAHKLAA